MNKFLFVPLLLVAFAFISSAQAAKQDPDQLLNSIKADIAAKRLSSPLGNNAQERIEAFRELAPFDYRILPLAYDWGKANVALANNSIVQKQYSQAQDYLDRVWFVAPLTPGLEAAQENLDKVYKAAPKVASAAAPTKADLERQRASAEQAAKDKARVEAEQKRQEAAEKLQAEQAKKKAAEELAKRQEQERVRRADADKKPAPVAKVVSAPVPVVKAPVPIVKAPVVAAVVAPVVVPAVTKASPAVLWKEAEEDSAPIASYPIPNVPLQNRDRDLMAKALQPVCKAIIDNNASVVVHTTDKSEYRWLTVRLTLCLRGLDKEFRLRHSHQDDNASAEPYISLHPARDVSLVRQAGEE